MTSVSEPRPGMSEGAKAFLAGPHGAFIDGKFADPHSDEIIEVENPARETIVARVRAAGLEDLDRAVAAARHASEGPWGAMPGKDRARILLRFADLIEARAEFIGEIETIEAGLPLSMTVPTLSGFCAELLRYYAGWATKIEGATIPAVANGREENDLLVYTVREPVGVVGAIVPWNAPAGMIILKMAPALAAGCVMVLKPAELAPLTAELIAEAWRDAGGPRGVFNVVQGRGATIGAALVGHPGVDKITFTGSTEVGKSIVRAASHDLRRVSLELGGKSPFVVFPDAPLEEAAAAAAFACFLMSGQNCMAATRLFVHSTVRDRFVDRLIDATRHLPVGDGLATHTFVGPLISAAHREKVLGFIASAEVEGARILYGGEVPADLAGVGHFVCPTIVDRVTPTMRIAREEVFGPVLAVQTFGDNEDALARAVGESRYGLSGSVWTRDLTRAHRFARRIDSGQVGVNIHAAISPETPFGGRRQSGWGREFGREGLDGYLETKAISVNLGARASS